MAMDRMKKGRRVCLAPMGKSRRASGAYCCWKQTGSQMPAY